jgi:mannose-1-phosphate guanylyltransferase
MIPLIGKPIMQTIVEHLRDSGFDQIMVNTSHLAPSIEDYFGDGSNFGVEMAYSFEGALNQGRLEGEAIGSAGGMRRIQDFSGFFDDTFVVLCGDALGRRGSSGSRSVPSPGGSDCNHNHARCSPG